MRPGWGYRHPALVELLRSTKPAGSERTAWANGTVPLRISAYSDVASLPDELVVGVRCLVRVEESIVVCTNADGISHPWPGGGRKPGESFIDTACREVLEETGWILQPATVRELGWLHLEHLLLQDDDHPYPHPDFLQVVFAGRAAERSGGREAMWSDTEGYELSSELMSLEAAYQTVDDDPLSRVFLDLLR